MLSQAPHGFMTDVHIAPAVISAARTFFNRIFHAPSGSFDIDPGARVGAREGPKL